MGSRVNSNRNCQGVNKPPDTYNLEHPKLIENSKNQIISIPTQLSQSNRTNLNQCVYEPNNIAQNPNLNEDAKTFQSYELKPSEMDSHSSLNTDSPQRTPESQNPLSKNNENLKNLNQRTSLKANQG